jgi:hypothetical protein
LSWDGDGHGGRDPDSQARSQSDGAVKGHLLEGISNAARMPTIADFWAPSSRTTVLGVTRGVARHLVPDAGRPRDPPNRQFRSPPSGCMSPWFAPRSNYGIRPYVQSITGTAAAYRDEPPRAWRGADGPLDHYQAFCAFRLAGVRIVFRSGPGFCLNMPTIRTVSTFMPDRARPSNSRDDSALHVGVGLRPITLSRKDVQSLSG